MVREYFENHKVEIEASLKAEMPALIKKAAEEARNHVLVNISISV